MRNNSSLLLVLIAISCKPDFEAKRIENDFAREFPTYHFISSEFETKGDTTFVSVKFKKPTSERSWIDKWRYVISSKEWQLFQTGKKNLIKPLEPVKNGTIKNALNQLRIRSIKVDSILYSKDTLDSEFVDYVVTLLYHGDTLNERTYIPEGDSISIVYQRHLGNIEKEPFKYPKDTTK